METQPQQAIQVVMESDSNNVINRDTHKMDIKVEIKKEPKGTCEEFETVYVPSHFAKDCSNDSETNNDETCNKMQIKEEPCVPKSTSNETKQEMELDCVSNADLKNETKEPGPHTEVITGDVGTEEASRSQTESKCRNSGSASCFYTSTNSQENSWGNNYPNISETSPLFIFGQQQMFEAPETNYSLVSFVNNNMIQDCTPHGYEICGNGFSFAAGLKTHTLRRHTCDVCGKTFTEPYSLQKHKLIHEAQKERTCDVCNKSFTRLSNLRSHKLIHEGLRPHACEFCNKSFLYASGLIKHKLIHKGERLHACEICNKSFFYASGLKKHKLIHESLRPYACEICSMRFTDTYHLKNHKLIHERKKPYTCEICRKTYSQKSYLNSHRLLHLDKAPHTCEICKKSFIKASSLKIHKLIHAEEMPQTNEINKSLAPPAAPNEIG